MILKIIVLKTNKKRINESVKIKKKKKLKKKNKQIYPYKQ